MSNKIYINFKYIITLFNPRDGMKSADIDAAFYWIINLSWFDLLNACTTLKHITTSSVMKMLKYIPYLMMFHYITVTIAFFVDIFQVGNPLLQHKSNIIDFFSSPYNQPSLSDYTLYTVCLYITYRCFVN